MPIRRTPAALVAAALATAIAGAGTVARAAEVGPVAEAMFDRADADGNGYVGKDELKASRERLFDRLDADRDGFATTEEMAAARDGARKRGARRMARFAEQRAQMPSPAERLAQLDGDRDGRLSRAEFVTGVNPRFDALDDGRGVSKADFAELIERGR